MTTTTFRLFFDMDGVLVDFDAFLRELNADPARALPDGKPYTGQHVKVMLGAYRDMKPIAGALEGIRKVMSIAGQYGGEVWLATKPPTGIAWAYADKVEWVLQHLPELKRRIIITHDKGLLGGPADYLVDDRPHRANCVNFKGTLIRFGGKIDDASCAKLWTLDWDALVRLLHRMMRTHAESRARAPSLLPHVDTTLYRAPAHGGYPEPEQPASATRYNRESFAGGRFGGPVRVLPIVTNTSAPQACDRPSGCTNRFVCSGRGTCSPWTMDAAGDEPPVVRTGEHNGGPYDTRN